MTDASPRDLFTEAFRRIIVHASDVGDGPEITNIRTALLHPGVVSLQADGRGLDVWFTLDNGYMTARVGRPNTIGNNDQLATFPITTGFRECGEMVSRAIAAFIA